jgi:ketosteroid isomerase-like protein
MSSDVNQQTVRRAFQALVDGNLGPLRDLLAPGAVLHQCGFLEPISAQAILQRDLSMQGRLQDRQFQLERIVGEGDTVALHWRTSGRYSDPDSAARDGTHVSFPSMTFVRMADGQIAEIWNIQDISTLQTQLELSTQPPSDAGSGGSRA